MIVFTYIQACVSQRVTPPSFFSAPSTLRMSRSLEPELTQLAHLTFMVSKDLVLTFPGSPGPTEPPLRFPSPRSPVTSVTIQCVLFSRVP